MHIHFSKYSLTETPPVILASLFWVLHSTAAIANTILLLSLLPNKSMTELTMWLLSEKIILKF